MAGVIHTRYSAGYKAWVNEAESCHRGWITVIWQEEAGCKVEDVTNYGPNVVNFTILVGWEQWFVVGAYGTHNNQPAVHWL